MQQNPSWDANSYLPSQEIPCILWNTEVHYQVQRCMSSIPVLNEMYLFTPPHSASLRPIFSSHLCLGLSRISFPQVFWPKLCQHFYSLPCYILQPPHPPWFNHPSNIWRGVQLSGYSFCCFLTHQVKLQYKYTLHNKLYSPTFNCLGIGHFKSPCTIGLATKF